jgi:ketosteroid isomerase-like protein
MSIENNKNVVKSLLNAFAAGDLDRLEPLLTDDFTFWLAPTTIFSGIYSREKWLQSMSATFDNGPLKLQFGDFTAEDDRVSLTMEGHQPQKNGKVYANHYHFLFFLRDGKISAIKEYSDTYHVGEIFGFPNATA